MDKRRRRREKSKSGEDRRSAPLLRKSGKMAVN
jgi:hypothetical protein